MRAQSRRYKAPSAEPLRDKLMAASLNAWRTRFIDLCARADTTLPPLSLVLGHNPT
jgi:hypothetical protein